MLELRLLAFRLELLGRAVAAVGLAFLDQARGLLAVEVEAFRLAVGLVRASLVPPLVPVEAEPAQALVDQGFVLRPGALRGGVIDPKGEGAPLRAGKEDVGEGR